MVCFSFGVVMWEMLTRERPHSSQATLGPLVEKARLGQLALSIPESTPAAYKQLLCGKLILKDLFAHANLC